jgi:hypothetical protein
LKYCGICGTPEVQESLINEGAKITSLRMIATMYRHHEEICKKKNCDYLLYIQMLGDLVQRTWKE